MAYVVNNPHSGLNGREAELPLALSILKQMDMGLDTEGSFTGEFTTKKVRTLEKKDLTCIDKFQYHKVAEYEQDLVFVEKLKDQLCTRFASTNGTSFYKCPTFNCERVEVAKEDPYSFIPKSIVIRKVSVNSKKKVIS
jgi:hypothetical protein